jgi:membrane fusion protein (multidrug efflux system)
MKQGTPGKPRRCAAFRGAAQGAADSAGTPKSQRRGITEHRLCQLLSSDHRRLRPSPGRVRRVVLAAAVAACLALPALAQQAAPVGTIIAAKQPVSRELEFTGRVEAINRVDVRARVTGYLEAVLFKEGEIVKEGDKLFQIESAPFEAAVQQAQGALLQAQGGETNAKLQLQRANELIRSGNVSVAVRDQRIAEAQNAQGGVVRADADLKTAQINLGFATIVAPITGRIGRVLLTKGNLVGPESGSLTLIVSQDPMYVIFPVSQREFLRLREEGNKTNRENAIVRLRFADGSVYDQTGRINFVDVTVDRGTDTVLVRAQMPNAGSALVPDQFVRVSVAGEIPEERVVIPQAALIADQEGTYVFVVEDGKAAVKRVKLGPEVGTGIAVESGLAAGDQVVVNGMQSLRPGAAVFAKPITDSPGTSAPSTNAPGAGAPAAKG